MKESAGTLIYRHTPSGIELLLVHPSGNYNRKAPWGIPKGLPDPEESLEEAARRETMEETGMIVRDLVPLGYCDYAKSRKRIHCFVSQAADDVEPSCASWEVDKVEFLPVDEARRLIHPDQAVFIERLLSHLAQSPEEQH